MDPFLVTEVSGAEPYSQQFTVEIEMDIGRPVFLVLRILGAYLKGNFNGFNGLGRQEIAGDTVLYPAGLKPQQGGAESVGTAEVTGIIRNSDQTVPGSQAAGWPYLIGGILAYRNGNTVKLGNVLLFLKGQGDLIYTKVA